MKILRMHALLMVFLISLTIPNISSAANHYIRDGATGSSPCTAGWGNTQACDSLPATLVRGDTYYIADGTYGDYTFDDAKSGTSVIHIKKATATDHGTDAGWNSAYGDGQALFVGHFLFQDSYYEINGQYRNADWKSGYGFKILFSGSNGMEVDRADIDNITVKYVEIEGWTITGNTCTRALKFTYGQHNNLYFGYGYYHYINGATVSTGGTIDSVVEYNFISDNNSNATCHGEAFAPSVETNFTIRYNKIYNTMGSGTIFFLSRGGTARDVNDNIQIYGNVIYGVRGDIDHGVISVMNHNVAQNWKIYNNTIVDYTGYSIDSGIKLSTEFVPYSGTAIHSNIKVYNNLWYNSTYGGLYCQNASYCTDYSATHNYYMGELGTHRPDYSDEESYSTLDSSIFSNYSADDFTLAKATNSGYTTGLNNTDMRGNIRGADGIWDRGAFEHGSGVSADTMPPSSPTNLIRIY